MKIKFWTFSFCLILLYFITASSAKDERDRWNSYSHIRRQFKKLEKRLGDKSDAINVLEERCTKLEKLLEIETKKSDEVVQIKMILHQLENKMLKQEKEFVSSVLELYSRFPNKETYKPDYDVRDVRHAVVNQPHTIMAKKAPKNLFGEESNNQEMLVIGGLSRYTDSRDPNNQKFLRRSDVLSFDPRTNSTITLSKLPEARAHHCSVTFEKKVYVIGGTTVNEKLLQTDIVLMDWGWDNISPMKIRRKALSCSVFRGRIWTCGGNSAKKSPIITHYQSCESYHPSDGWRMEASLSEPRQYSAAVTTSRGIFIIGGGSRTRSMSRSVELVQLTKDKFEYGPEPPTQGHIDGPAATVVLDTIFLMGGYSTYYRSYEQSVFALYPHENKWRKIGNLQHSRYGFNVAHMNGLMYVVGGNSDYDFEYFDISDPGIFNKNTHNLTSQELEVSYPAGNIRPLVRRFHTMVVYKP